MFTVVAEVLVNATAVVLLYDVATEASAFKRSQTVPLADPLDWVKVTELP
jgi:hypothetical protein